MSCCKKCGCNPCKCADPCGCPAPVLSIEQMLPDNLAYLRFNLNGYSTAYDFTSMVRDRETDTSLAADVPNRVLRYTSEKHVDALSSATIGSIIHLSDLGDVDGDYIEDGSFLIYEKNSDCGEGCIGLNNSWTAWNSLDELTDSMTYLMGFDAEGKAASLNTPTTTSEYYYLGWNSSNKVSWTQPVEVSTPPTDSDGYSYLLFVDPETRQIVYTKVTVEIDSDTNEYTITGA